MPTWADLRGVGNSAPVRASIVVPVIGYLIILNSTLADYLKLHGVEWVHQPAGVWDRLWAVKLYLVYFGLMFLGIGAAIYQWKCPPFIKKYSNWADYVAGVEPYTELSQIDALAEIVGIPLEIHDFRRQGDELKFLLRAHYAQMSSYYPRWRLAEALLFGAGFLLLAIPSGMTAVRVAIALFF